MCIRDRVSAGEVELDKNDEPVLDKTGSEDKKAKDYNPNYGQPIVRKKDSTSWDSFSYAIQMGHNVWTHVNAVQEANRQYDAGVVPKMLMGDKFQVYTIRDMINEVFEQPTKELSLAKIIEYRSYWMQVPGTRGAIGKKTISAKPKFAELFDVQESEADEELDETKLEELQDEQL